MTFPLLDLLKTLPIIGPAVASTSEFLERFDDLLKPLSETDQDELKAALEDLMLENDEGHARLQAKLERAAQR